MVFVVVGHLLILLKSTVYLEIYYCFTEKISVKHFIIFLKFYDIKKVTSENIN
jgi:hypothetical protein